MSQPYLFTPKQVSTPSTATVADHARRHRPGIGRDLLELDSRCYPVTLPHYKIRMGELFFGNSPLSYVSPTESHLLLHASGQTQIGRIVDPTVSKALPPFVRDAIVTSSQRIADIAELKRTAKGKKRVVVLSGEPGVAELRMGAWIASRKDEFAIDIVTAFSASQNLTHVAFPTGIELCKIRIQESALSARILGAAPLFLEFTMSDVDRDAKFRERLSLILMRYCRATQPEILFIPLGSSVASRFVLDVVLGLHTARAIPVRQLILYNDFGAINSVDTTSDCLARLAHTPFQLEEFQFDAGPQIGILQTCMNVFQTFDCSPSLSSRDCFWTVADYSA